MISDESIELRQCTQNDIKEIAELYVEIYRSVNPIEKWVQSSAVKLISYFYKKSYGLFYLATSNKIIVGGIWGQIKPWWNGNKVYNLEVFVKKEFQRQGI